MQSGIKETPTEEDPFKGWRGVVYVCYRPKSEFSQAQLELLEDCLENNRGTNHWATWIWPLRRSNADKPIDGIPKLLEQPDLVYGITKFKPHKKSFLINETLVEA